MLSKRSLYPDTGGGMLPGKNSQEELDMILWLLFYCDGKRSLPSISRELDIPLEEVGVVANMLKEKGVLERVDGV